ncbi:putative 2-dehydro-3-deoxyphosphogluconate aldolase [Clostridium pasteurianum DSM 525 = ATCC 6013]|uniref:KDPG and KHG aldolase n=1 Tax=Clostridium pasteurianum DSM 525 = ATCC 6013 TaxID=1262449 RepID=A0A0H3J6U3_CLOPA|nr:bifunctional 4-hydroxy-2-oxoglutarate aldolase/2-dehydro-3-deoxy-phosphogluconate aldolase [Clostridium pasteurianum]AJA46695.1 putative 2-dehydro-3-deoxyphosphogluconate aldolase [Clostridium pasteurianum DSM 525 = ATCC 6013]AJA50683.1 putative 2-dehydro-3-deoxyphosphogluconate aldolase [Clostridium pasteurianum DSM 525 = ATCC 6013]AOZ74100.1 2-dehydro-3-deoxyphosphogluconate aldolase [Clostridium pasteurianum DSM 525 = ATCC 6013]AOZ77897.1 2-dehydro-3-deoxyphosphogluconate aldolase [Clostr
MDIKNFPKVTIILRGYNYNQTETVINALIGSSINSVEITMNTKGSIDMISDFHRKYGDRIHIGAGTVTNLENVKRAVNAGAEFILSPVLLSREIINFCKENSVITIPGAMSPTEIYKSFEDGADIVKVFPAVECGSKFFKDVKAPLGELPLMAVGGINKENSREFLSNGADFLGIGSGVFNKEDILNENMAGLMNSLNEFEEKIGLEGVKNEW